MRHLLTPKALDRLLDRLVRVEFFALDRPWPAFQVCGYAGLALAIVVAMGLVARQGLALWVMTLVILAAVLTFLSLALATKIITGRENLVYYYHEVAVMATSTICLLILGQPILPYLEPTLLGIGAFLACGRVGCLMVGCCHGRPATWGVRYQREHARAGFTSSLVGVRLMPVQAFESLLVLGIVAIGIAITWNGELPGSALGCYVIAYGVARFCLEFLRGDGERRYFWGFSEAQWFSLSLAGLLVATEAFGALPFRWWHVVAFAGLLAAMVGVSLDRRGRGRQNWLLEARHVVEIAAVLDRVASWLPRDSEGPSGQGPGCPRVAMERTSRGLLVSAGENGDGKKRVRHYALSLDAEPLSEISARRLAELIVRLRHPSDSLELIRGGAGVYHLLVRPLATDR